MWTRELFGHEKPIIALLHLDPLPGDPGFCGNIESVVRLAAADLQALQDGGADGVLIANEFSLPYTDKTAPETVMAMAYIIGRLKKILKVPFGVNVVLNPEATIRLAAATGASFGRSAFGGTLVGEYGVHSSDFGVQIRTKYAVGRPDMHLLCKINPEGDAWLTERPVEEIIDGICASGYADALCVSGPGAGQEASFELLERAVKRADKYHVPVFCNTGCRMSTIQKILEIAGGACVGTAFKDASGRVSLEKVRAFIQEADKARD